jgi:hypothetical protein
MYVRMGGAAGSLSPVDVLIERARRLKFNENIPSGPRSTFEGLESKPETGPNRLLGGIIQTLCGMDYVGSTLYVAFFILFFCGGRRRLVLFLEFRHDGQLGRPRVAMGDQVVWRRGDRLPGRGGGQEVV